MLDHHPECINLKDTENCTPLHRAILKRSKGVALYLLQQVRALILVALFSIGLCWKPIRLYVWYSVAVKRRRIFELGSND